MRIFICLLLSSLSVFADDYTLDKATGKALPHFVGEIKSFRGKVLRRAKDKSEKQVQEGDQFYKADTVVTGEKSVAKVLMVDETVVTLGPNSELRFEEFDFKDKNDRRIHSYIRGQLTGHVKNKAKDGAIQFKTQNAVMGVRGTQFALNHRKVGDLEISEFAVLSGNIEVQDDKNQRYALKRPDKIVIVRNTAGESAHDNTPLSSEELNLLESEDKIYGPDFRPFLPFFDPLSAKEGSSMYAFIHSKALPKSAPVTPTKDVNGSEKRDGSFENLKKLNDQLQKNRR